MKSDSGGPIVCVAPVGSRSDKKLRPAGSNLPDDSTIPNRANVPVTVQLRADDEASCRCATRPPAYHQKGRDGRATRWIVPPPSPNRCDLLASVNRQIRPFGRAGVVAGRTDDL